MRAACAATAPRPARLPARTSPRIAPPPLSTRQHADAFKGEVGNAHCIENGDPDGENHWDKFLETPVAQAAIEREMEELKTY